MFQIAWMDENISFDDCSGHICEQPELKFGSNVSALTRLVVCNLFQYGSDIELVHHHNQTVAANS